MCQNPPKHNPLSAKVVWSSFWVYHLVVAGVSPPSAYHSQGHQKSPCPQGDRHPSRLSTLPRCCHHDEDQIIEQVPLNEDQEWDE